MNKCKKLYNAENAKQAGAELGQAHQLQARHTLALKLGREFKQVLWSIG